MPETRTEYVVFIPDNFWQGARREVCRYPEQEQGEDPGEQRAREHVTHIHDLAARMPDRAGRRAEAFAVKQTITVEETLLTPDSR